MLYVKINFTFAIVMSHLFVHSVNNNKNNVFWFKIDVRCGDKNRAQYNGKTAYETHLDIVSGAR